MGVDPLLCVRVAILIVTAGSERLAACRHRHPRRAGSPVSRSRGVMPGFPLHGRSGPGSDAPDGQPPPSLRVTSTVARAGQRPACAQQTKYKTAFFPSAGVPLHALPGCHRRVQPGLARLRALHLDLRRRRGRDGSAVSAGEGEGFMIHPRRSSKTVSSVSAVPMPRTPPPLPLGDFDERARAVCHPR